MKRFAILKQTLEWNEDLDQYATETKLIDESNDLTQITHQMNRLKTKIGNKELKEKADFYLVWVVEEVENIPSY